MTAKPLSWSCRLAFQRLSANAELPQAILTNQQLALEALPNVVIDTGNQVVSASLWHEAHKQKCPDLDRRRAQEGRHTLIEARIITIDEGRVWIVNKNN